MSKINWTGVLWDLGIPQRTDTEAFTYRLTPKEAAIICKAMPTAEIMCKEYGMDESCDGEICDLDENGGCVCWSGVTSEDLNEETGEFDEDYKTFEIWA